MRWISLTLSIIVLLLVWVEMFIYIAFVGGFGKQASKIERMG